MFTRESEAYYRMLKTCALLSALLFVATSARGALTLEAEVGPDPVANGESLDLQISVASTSTTGTLTLRLLWISQLGSNDDPDGITDGGDCPGTACDPGEFLTWNLGTLPSGGTRTVSVNERVNAAADGTFTLDIQLLEDGLVATTLSRQVEVQSDSPLEIFVDPLFDPVPSGGTLVYEIVYGNISAASAENAALSFTLAAGTQFQSATGNGVPSGNTVSWNLGALAPGAGGRERLTVDVDPVANGTLLSATAALAGAVNFQARAARAMAVSRVDTEVLELAMEINPNPVAASELLDTQISIGNLGGTVTGSLTLRVLWPAEFGTNDDPEGVTDGGDCPGTACDTGEYLTWNLGLLGPGVTRTVSLNEIVAPGGSLLAGQLIPVEIELLEAGLPARNVSHTVIALSDSPLEIFVDPLLDPVPSAGTLVYEIVYGNTSAASAENAALSFTLPAGTQFRSVTGGGVPSGNTVSWDLGALGPGDSGRERLTVDVDPLANGTLLSAMASVVGAVNFQTREARATAVSRVDTEVLELAMEINPGPVAASELLETQISVANLGAAVTGSLTLRVLWPVEFGTNDDPEGVTDGGDCPGTACDNGEYLTWNLGPLGPGVTRTVSLNEIVSPGGTLLAGQLIPVEIELLEGGLPARTVSHTVIALSDSPLEISVDPLSDPVPSGGTLVYEIVYGNAGAASAGNAVLSLPLPAGSQFQSATGGGILSGNTVSWNLGSLAANSGGRHQVTVTLGALADNSLLVVDSATLTGEVNFRSKLSRATAVSRVAAEPLELDVVLGPNPVQASQLVTGDLTVNNPTGSSTGSLTLRLLWRVELGTNDDPVTTDGGACPGTACDTGEYLTWNLGPLGPGGARTVSFNENVEPWLVNGELVVVEIELLDGGLPAQTFSRTLLTHPFADNDHDGVADVLDDDDDNDGMPDLWEQTHGLDPFNATDATQDPDGDGADNLEEFLLGTDPNVSDFIFADGFESGNTSAW